MATASESPQPLPVPAPITAVDEKDPTTEVPESSHLLEELKKAESGINGTSETIGSSKIAVILQLPTDPILETLNDDLEVHVAKEGGSFLEPPPIEFEKEETDREQDYSVIVEPPSMAEKEITDDQTEEMLKKQEGEQEEEEISNREIRTVEEIKKNEEEEEGLIVPEGFDTIQTETEESVPEVREETQKEEPLGQGTEIMAMKEAFSEERAQKVEEPSFPKEDDADESFAEEKTLTEGTASLTQSIGVSSHASDLTIDSSAVKVETEDAPDKEEENSKLVTDKDIVAESQKEAEDQTELVDQSIKLERSLDDQHEVLTTENSCLVKEEISTATEEQKEETFEVLEVQERKEKEIPAIEEPRKSSPQDDDPEVQTLDESLHIPSKNVETTDSSEIAKDQELGTEGKVEDNAADDDHISEDVVEKNEVLPPQDSDEKTEGEEIRAADDSDLIHVPVEETETGGELDGAITASLDEKIPEASQGFHEEEKFEVSETSERREIPSLTSIHKDVDETTEITPSGLEDAEKIEFEEIHGLADKGISEFDTSTTNTEEKIEKNEDISYMKEDHGEQSEVQEDTAPEVHSKVTLVGETNQQNDEVEIVALESNTQDRIDEADISGQINAANNEVHEATLISAPDEIAEEQAGESNTSHLSTEATEAETIKAFDENKEETSKLDEEEIKTEVTEALSVRELVMPTAENPVTSSQNDLVDEQQSEKELPEDSDATKVNESIVSRTLEDDEFSKETSVSSLLEQEEIDDKEFVNSAPDEETKSNEELSATDHPTNLGESTKLVDSENLESSVGKESEISVDQETSIIPLETSTERNVLEPEQEESSEKLETSKREYDEEPSNLIQEKIIKETDDVLIQQGHEGSDRNDNLEEQTTQEESYGTGLLEAPAEKEVVTEAETAPTIPTEEVVQKCITHEESSSTEIAQTIIVVETIQSSEEEVKEENSMDRAEEVQTCERTEADIAENTSEPKITEKDQTREFLVQSHISKEDVENVEAVNPVLEEKGEAKEDDILTNEASPDVAVNEKIEGVNSQEESVSTEIISLENDSVQQVRNSEPDSLSLENPEIIKDEQVSQSDPEEEELMEVTTGLVAVHESDERRIQEDKPEETETKRDLEELTTESTKEQLQELQINKDELTAHLQETETTRKELEEVTAKLAEEPQPEATKIVTTERAFQSTEPESKDEDIEEETADSGLKQVDAIITSEPVAELEEAKTEVIEEVKTDSAEEQQVEAIQIIINDQTTESEEANKVETEEVIAERAEEQQSQASQIITHERSIQPEEVEIKDSDEITRELAEEHLEEVVLETEPIPQSETAKKEKLEEEAPAESAKEPEYEASQDITHDQGAQSEEREIKKKDLGEGLINPEEEQQVEAIIENKLISQSEEAKKELQEVTVKPVEEPQPERTAEEDKKEKLEEVIAESAKEPQSEAIHAIDCEEVAQLEEVAIKQENLEEATIETVEKVAAETAKEIESESAKEKQVEAIQIITDDQTPESEETKKEELEEVTAEKQQSQASRIITLERFIQPEEPEIQNDPEGTTELVDEQQSEVIKEDELIPQSEAAEKEKLEEEVAAESAKEPESEATQAITLEQAQTEEQEINKADLVEGTIRPTEGQREEQQVEAIIENKLISQSEEAKKELQEVTVKPVEEPQPERTAEEDKKEKLEEVIAESAKEPQSEAIHAIDCEEVAQLEEVAIKQENLEEATIETVEKVAAETAKEIESESAKEKQVEAIQIITDDQTPESEETKKEELEEVTAEKQQSQASRIITLERFIQPEEPEIQNDPEGTTELVDEQQSEVIKEDELIPQSEAAEKEKLEEEVAAESAKEPESEATQAITLEQAQTEEQEINKADLVEGTIRPTEGQREEQQVEAIIENKLISQSEEAKKELQEVTVKPVEEPQPERTAEEDKKEKLEEVIAESAKEPQSEAIHAIDCEEVAQLEEVAIKQENLEEATIETVEKVAAETAKEIESESAKEKQVEAIQIITDDQTPESEETKKEELEEVTAEKQQSQASRIITLERFIQPEEPEIQNDPEGTTELVDEQQSEVIKEDELIPQSEAAEKEKLEEEVAAESAKEPESEATQAITLEQAQTEEQEINKADLVEGTIRPTEGQREEQQVEAIIENKLISQSEEAKKELQEVTVKPVEEPQPERTAEEDKKEKLEEVIAESAKEPQSEAIHAIDCEEVAQLEEVAIKQENLEEATIETVEKVAAETAKEIESESAKEKQVEAIQIITDDQTPESEETKKEELEEVTAEKQQSQASRIITLERFIQPEEPEIQNDPEGTTELVDEQQSEVIKEDELIPQSEAAEKEKLEEEVAAESAKEPESEATQAITLEQAQTEEQEINKADLVEGTIRPTEGQRVEAIIESELISQTEEAKIELQEVTVKPVEEPQPEATIGEAKKETLEQVTTEPAREPESSATQVMDYEQVAQLEELDIKKENLEEGKIEPDEVVAAESARETESESRETESETSQVTSHEHVAQSGQLGTEKDDIAEETIEPAEGIAAASARETESEAFSKALAHEQVSQSEQLETNEEDLEEGKNKPAEEQQLQEIIPNELISQSEEAPQDKLEEVTNLVKATPAITDEEVAQSEEQEIKKEDLVEGAIKPAEEQQVEAPIENELIFQSGEAKKEEPQSEAIQTITLEQVAESEESETKKMNLEEGTAETVGEDPQETIQVIENESIAKSEEVKAEKLQEVATETVEERDLEALPIISHEQVAQSEETENEDLGRVRTESPKEQQVEAIIKSESIDQSEETKIELDEMRTESKEQPPLEAVQIVSREQVAQSEAPQTKKREVDEETTDSTEEQKTEAMQVIKDAPIAQLVEDEREEHENVPTQSADEQQTEVIQILKREQAGQSDELETEINGAETVIIESKNEPKFEETPSLKNDQAPQLVEPQLQIEDLAAVTTELAQEQLLDKVQINENKEATEVEEPTTKTEDIVGLPTLSTEEEKFEAREITKKEISVEESAEEKEEMIQPEETVNEIQQTDDVKSNDLPQKQDVNQQTEEAEKADANESLKEEIEQTEAAEKFEATESLKEETELTDNEASKLLLQDDGNKVQNSEIILSETEKGQSENEEILSEPQREAPLPQATEAEPEKKKDQEKPEEISVVNSDVLEESPEEAEIKVVTSEDTQILETSEVASAQTFSLGVSMRERLLELEHGTKSTSSMPSEQPPQDKIETERSSEYLEEVESELEVAEKAHETALEEQVDQPDVDEETPEEVITKSIQEQTESTQITRHEEATEEIPQEKEMVSESHQGSPQEKNTHMAQPSEERVMINKEGVQESDGFGEVVEREILKEEVMTENNDGPVSIKEVEVSEKTSKGILESAKFNDEKEAEELKDDEIASDLQEASSLSENPQPNLTHETSEEKPRDVDILKFDETEEIVKLETAEQQHNEANENENKDSELKPLESCKPTETENAQISSHGVCQDEEILDSKDDTNSTSEQVPGEVIKTKINEDNLEAQSREEIPESAEPEEKKVDPEEVFTELVQEEQIESFPQTTQNSVEEHEQEKEVITQLQEMTLPEQITKEPHEEEPKEEETDSATKIEEGLRETATSQDRSELIEEKNLNDGNQSSQKEAVEEDLKQTEGEFKTVGSSAESAKQEVLTSDSLTPVAEEEKGTLPEEDITEKVLKEEVIDRAMDFKEFKAAHVSEELELKVSNDSAEEKAALLEEESSAKELPQEEINGSSIANLVISEEVDKQTVAEALKNEVSSGNVTELVSVTAEDEEKLSQEVETKREFQVEELNTIVALPQEKDAAKTEEESDFLVQEENKKEVATITESLNEEDPLTADSSKAVDTTSEKAETISEDAETPSSALPGIEISVQEEEKIEVETIQMVVDAIPDVKNEEPLTILSSNDELTEADSSNETIEMSKSITVLLADIQKEVPEKEQINEHDISNVHESHLESDKMVDTTRDSLLLQQASQELEGSEKVDDRNMLEKEIRQKESAITELLAVNADTESNKEVREIGPVSVEELKPTEFNAKTETSKLENYEDLSDIKEVSTLSEEPKSQPKEIAEEKLEEPVDKDEDVQKDIETHDLESKPQDNISAPALTIANAGGQNVVEGTITPTSLGESQDEEILYVGNVKGNESSIEQPTAVIVTEIPKDSVEDTTLQSSFAEKVQVLAPHKTIEEVSQLEYEEIKKNDIEEVITKSVAGEQTEAIPFTKTDSSFVEEVMEKKEEVTECHQVSPHEETLKEVKETDDLKAEETVMQFAEETGKPGTRDYVEEEITREERALKDQLEADAEDKKTYVFIDDERQDTHEEEAKLNLESKDSLPKLEAEVQLPEVVLEKLPEVTLGTKDERETFITSDETKPQTELGFQTAKLPAEEKNAIAKAGEDNIGNGLNKRADDGKQPPAEVVGSPENNPDYEKDAATPLKPEGGEIGVKFGVDEKVQEPCSEEQGKAVVNEMSPEKPERSSQYIEPKPEFDFEKMGIQISNTEIDKNTADGTQLNKAEEQGEFVATERAWKLEETPDAASLENPKDATDKPVQESTAEGAEKAENFSDKDHTHCEETAQRDLDDKGDENKREDSGSDGPVLVEASKDMEANKASPHKKHHNILSGVGSKVKHSISKVKKAITGKSSSHPKSESPDSKIA